MGLRDVVALHERRRCQFPIHRQPTRLPPLDAQGLHLPGVVDRRKGLEAVAQRRRVVVEVDPRASAPKLTSDRYEANIFWAQVVLVELFGSQHERIASVDAPAPAVEWADERTSIPVAFHQLYAAVTASVVVCPDVLVVDPDHDDRLIEHLVLHEITRLGDLLEPAGHLPHAR